MPHTTLRYRHLIDLRCDQPVGYVRNRRAINVHTCGQATDFYCSYCNGAVCTDHRSTHARTCTKPCPDTEAYAYHRTEDP